VATKEPEKPAPKPRIRETLDIDIRPRGEPKRSNAWVWWVGGIIILGILIFFIIPAIKGYNVYTAMRAADVPEQYVTDMSGLNRDKTAAEQQSAADKAALEKKDIELTTNRETLGSCKKDLNACAQDSANREKEAQDLIESLSKDVADAKNGQEANGITIADAARRICCAQRIENPSINSYSVVNDKIVCVQDGGTALTC
jgi:hypothetical protein